MSDHSNAKPVSERIISKTRDVSCQTDFEPTALASSTPQKVKSEVTYSDFSDIQFTSHEVVSGALPSINVCGDPVMEEDGYLLNLSKISFSYRDYSANKTYMASDEDTDEEEFKEKELNFVKEPKYIVFGSAIDELFVRLKCNECECPVDPDDFRKEESDGTILRCSIYCTGGHLIHKWLSQPVLGKMPMHELLVGSGLYYPGARYRRSRPDQEHYE